MFLKGLLEGLNEVTCVNAYNSVWHTASVTITTATTIRLGPHRFIPKANVRGI